VFALEFPPIENLVEWPAYFGEGTVFAFNKIALISLLAVAIPAAVFLLAKKDLVPRGLQNIVELTIEFVEKQVVLAAIGPDGMRFLPLLLSLFLFVFFGNIFEVIPTFQMPANARMANPLFLALLVWVIFVGLGIKHHKLGYFKAVLFPPGVPKPIYFLVTPIEFISTFILRPFGLAVRLFANMLAGHILLVTFGVLCISLWQVSALAAVLPVSFAVLVALTGFEIMVSFLQAFIFALLAAVYIDFSLHPSH
jgi:F-type H+-transporting ATPase subunit a